MRTGTSRPSASCRRHRTYHADTVQIPCRYHADAIPLHTSTEPRLRIPRTCLALQVALRSARGGQEGACADGGGGASPAAAAAERDAAGGVRLDSETASAGAMAGESKGGQERGRAGLNVNSVGAAACFIRAACSSAKAALACSW